MSQEILRIPYLTTLGIGVGQLLSMIRVLKMVLALAVEQWCFSDFLWAKACLTHFPSKFLHVADEVFLNRRCDTALTASPNSQEPKFQWEPRVLTASYKNEVRPGPSPDRGLIMLSCGPRPNPGTHAAFVGIV